MHTVKRLRNGNGAGRITLGLPLLALLFENAQVYTLFDLTPDEIALLEANI
jgi:hypothetical protein